MGPRTLPGSEVQPEELIWQDPVPAVDHEPINNDDITALKAKLLAWIIGSRTRFTAWASASTFRGSDKRGGANGALYVWLRRNSGKWTTLQ